MNDVLEGLTAYPRFDSVTVQTGLITALCAIIDLVLFLVSVSPRVHLPPASRVDRPLPPLLSPQPTGLHLIFNLPLAKLYTNSLLSSLNSRALWSRREQAAVTTADWAGSALRAPRKGARAHPLVSFFFVY